MRGRALRVDSVEGRGGRGAGAGGGRAQPAARLLERAGLSDQFDHSKGSSRSDTSQKEIQLDRVPLLWKIKGE